MFPFSALRYISLSVIFVLDNLLPLFTASRIVIQSDSLFFMLRRILFLDIMHLLYNNILMEFKQIMWVTGVLIFYCFYCLLLYLYRRCYWCVCCKIKLKKCVIDLSLLFSQRLHLNQWWVITENEIYHDYIRFELYVEYKRRDIQWG